MLTGVRLMPRRQPPACKAGTHRFGAAQHVGPSILRRICVHCSQVSIDLTAEDAPPDPALFAGRPGTSHIRQ